MNEEELKKLKILCIKKANKFQEKADAWYIKAKEYNDKIVEIIFKGISNKDLEEREC